MMSRKELQALLDAFDIKPEDVVTDKNEQNKLIKKLLIDSKILSPIFNLRGPEQKKPVPLHFPNSTNELLKLHSKEQVNVLDVLYALMCKRRFLLMVVAQNPQIIKEVLNEGITADAALSVFADDYELLDTHGKKAIRIIDPYSFVQKELN
jgi:hypothetical protein